MGLVALVTIGLLAGCERGGIDAPVTESIPVDPPDRRGGAALFEVPAAVEVLRLQNRRDTQGLIEQLAHEEPGIRARAAFALASVRDSDAVPALVERLREDPDPAVRRDAAFALGHLAHEDAGEALFGTLEGEDDPQVRMRVLEALGLRAEGTVAERLGALSVPAEEAATHALALARVGLRVGPEITPETLDALVSGLSNPEPDVREASAYYFGRLPDPAPWEGRADPVREALDALEPNDPAAMHLVLAVGRLRDRDDASRFIDWMANAGDWRIRVNAARAVGTTQLLETPGIREALWERVETDPYEHVAIAAAQSLVSGFRVPNSVLERARSWIAEGPDRWRAKVPFVLFLGGIGDAQPVLDWVNENSGHSIGLARMAPLLLGEARFEEALRSIDRFVTHEDLRVRVAAMGTLAERWEFGSPGPELEEHYFELFTEALQDGHPHVAVKAAAGLSTPTFHPFGSVAVLVSAYEERAASGAPDPDAAGEGEADAGEAREAGIPVPSPDPELPVRTAILDALATIGDPAALPLIESALEDPDYRIRRAAADAQEDLTGQAIRGLDLPDPEVEIDPDYLAALGPEPRLVLETERGTIRIRLAPAEAPVTVQTLASYAEAGRYDGVIFHRVIGNFVTQGGDFSAGDGTGSTGVSIRTEITQIPFRRGTLGMASLGHDTEGSQFFLTHSVQPHLDGSMGAEGQWQAFTAFGWIEEGESIMDVLMEGDRILEATLVRDEGEGG